MVRPEPKLREARMSTVPTVLICEHARGAVITALVLEGAMKTWVRTLYECAMFEEDKEGREGGLLMVEEEVGMMVSTSSLVRWFGVCW